MRKYSSRFNRQILAKKIIAECERVKEFDVRASFGEACDQYDAKKDLFIYREKESNHFKGLIKDVAFDYSDGVIYCYGIDKKSRDTIGVFIGKTDGEILNVACDTKYFDISSSRGKELNQKYNDAIELKNKFVNKNDYKKR